MNLQMNERGALRHLLSMEQLPANKVEQVLMLAEQFRLSEPLIAQPQFDRKMVVNLFFENSTRTRTTFEIAARKLGCEVVNFMASTSSASKGESLLDTVDNLIAMGANLFVVRHEMSGAACLIARHAGKQGVSVINAGDGRHEHPTQALLDLFTIYHHKRDFRTLRVAIIGDVLHSRVARSQIYGLSALGCPEIRVIAPLTLLPPEVEQLGVQVYHDLHEGLRDVDVVIALRLQNERMQGAFLPSVREFYATYGLTPERLRLAKEDAIVMHPGPINRGVEVSSAVADSPQSVILQQVKFGIFVRMAVVSLLLEQGDSIHD